MNFDEFQNVFVKENKRLKMALALSLIIFSIGSVLMLSEKRYYLYQGKEIFEERPLAEEVCKLGFETLASGTPNPFVVSSTIIDLVAKEPFELLIDKFLLVKSLEEGACRILIRSEGKLMSFKIILYGNDDHPFYYKLMELHETELDSKDHLLAIDDKEKEKV